VHWLLEIPFDLPKQPFINVARIIGGVAAAVIAVGSGGPRATAARTRSGGRDRAAGRRGALPGDAAVVPQLGHGLVAAAPWSRRALSWLVFVSLMLVICYYPNGEDALYNWPYLAVCAALSALGAVSLHRVDPLHWLRCPPEHRRGACRAAERLSWTPPGSPIPRCAPPTPPAAR
jgi:alpha-1,6-mannosyltransferase